MEPEKTAEHCHSTMSKVCGRRADLAVALPRLRHCFVDECLVAHLRQSPQLSVEQAGHVVGGYAWTYASSAASKSLSAPSCRIQCVDAGGSRVEYQGVRAPVTRACLRWFHTAAGPPSPQEGACHRPRAQLRCEQRALARPSFHTR